MANIMYGGTKISIHALRGEGDEQAPKVLFANAVISIHALRGEGDEGKTRIFATKKFQSTPSVGRATMSPSLTRS